MWKDLENVKLCKKLLIEIKFVPKYLNISLIVLLFILKN
jgi:hypothetical protein